MHDRAYSSIDPSYVVFSIHSSYLYNMKRSRIIIRIFLASPSDVAKEREITNTVIAELNRSIAPKLGHLIELIRWEDMVPSMGRPEQVILDQADIENLDVFIGILWNRFGTPTGRANSGTEEEFDVALNTWRKNGKPRIMLYFCKRPTNLQTEEEIKQKNAVIKFRQRLSEIGIIRDYKSRSKFEILLRQDLTNHLLDIVTASKAHGIAKIPEPTSHIDSDSSKPVMSSDVNLENMAIVPAGEFLSGNPSNQATIDYDFHIDITPVTNLDFLKFVDETGYLRGLSDPGITKLVEYLRKAVDEIPDHPVTKVSWYDAFAFAAWQGKRLATALEWEKAARGTDGRFFPWGDDFEIELRCNCREAGIGNTTPVYKYKNGRSPYGCYDMAGNVFEWTIDWAKNSRHSKLPNSEKINCGGSFNRFGVDLVPWLKESDPPDLRMLDVGFRCVYVPK